MTAMEIDAQIVQELATRNVELSELIEKTPQMGHVEKLKLANEMNRNRRIIEVFTGKEGWKR